MSRYISLRPWLAPPPKEPLALILISYTVIDGEDTPVRCNTWATGMNAKAALRKWKSQWPERTDVTSTTVSETKKRLYDRNIPRGPRVDVIDAYLAATG